jgi:hypothetical protein
MSVQFDDGGLVTVPVEAALSPVADLLAVMRVVPQVPLPLTHRFQPGVYLREIFMPAGTVVVGYRHKTKHWNIVLTGSAEVVMERPGEEAAAPIVAPAIFESEAGVQKRMIIREDCRWLCAFANPDNCTDIATLEERFIEIDAETLAAKGNLTIDEFRMQQPTLTHDATPEIPALP